MKRLFLLVLVSLLAASLSHAQSNKSILEQAQFHLDSGLYEKAVAMFQKDISTRNSKELLFTADYSASLLGISKAYIALELNDKAKASIQLLKISFNERNDSTSSVFFEYLKTYAEFNVSTENYSAALSLYKTALEQLKYSTYTKDKSQSYEQKMTFGLARSHMYLKDDSAAIIWFSSFLEKRNHQEAKCHESYLHNCLFLLGVLNFNLGQYEASIKHYEDLLNIVSREYGEDHIDLVALLWRIGDSNLELGNFSKAEEIYQRTGRIIKNTHGSDHRYYCTNLNKEGVLYSSLNKYGRALHSFKEARNIAERINRQEYISYGQSLTYLGRVYSNLGQYANSEENLIDAMEHAEIMYGKNHLEYAIKLGDLAALYLDLGRNREAYSLYTSALDIVEQIYGEDDHRYANCLNDLGVVYSNLGQFDRSMELLTKSLEITKRTIGTKNSSYLTGLSNIASVYYKNDDYQKAIITYKELATTSNVFYGESHLEGITCKKHLVNTYLKIGQNKNARDEAISATSSILLNLENQFRFLAESEKLKYLKRITHYFDNNKVLAYIINKDHLEISHLIYDSELRLKNIILESKKEIQDAIKSYGDPEDFEKYNRWKIVNEFIARQKCKPLIERTASLDSLEKLSTSLEQQLVLKFSDFAKALKQNDITWKTVQQNLKKGEAAIEFISFPTLNEKSDSVLYAALLITHKSEHPIWIDLFEEKSLAKRTELKEKLKLDYTEQLYSESDRGTQVDDLGSSLGELIWDPIAKHLKGIKTIYYAPTGLLHRINLAAIAIDNDKVIGDEFNMHRLGSTRNVVIKTKTKKSKKALLFGGIEYNLSDSTIAAALSDTTGRDNRQYMASLSNLTDRSLRSGEWKNLKYTAKEAEKINKLMLAKGIETEYISGSTATEERFKQMKSPDVLHIATHGYFFPDPIDTQSHTNLDGSALFKYAEQPLLRSGLLLAGANHVWKGEQALPAKEDGIVTALEISEMDLSNTQLVVLSACETGLGDIDGNEGVFGLQRAFKQAGAEYIIMSLWQVPDFQTQDLLVTFYTNWLEKEMDITQAFKQAQLAMRDKYQSPYFWAGFVLMR